MKKGLLVAVMIAAVVFGAFADTVVEPSVSGSATLTWGMDLDTMYTGFKAEASGSIEVTLVDEATAESTGEGTWGYIKLENYKFAAASGSTVALTAPGVAEAKIVLGDSGAYIMIQGQPDLTSDMAPALDGDNVAGSLADADNTYYGFIFGYDMDMVSLGVDVVSDGDWTVNDNDYAFGVNMTITPADMFKTEIAFQYGDMTAGDMGFSVKPTLTLSDVMNGMDAWVGFDGSVPSEADFAFDVAFGTTLNFSEADGDDNKSNVAFNLHYGTDLDMTLDITELSGDDGAVAGLGATLGVDLFNLMNTVADSMAWNVDVTIDYTVDGIKPYAGFGLGSDDVFNLNVGVEMGSDFTGIDNTTLTLDYVSTDLQTTVDNGTLTFATKISM